MRGITIAKEYLSMVWVRDEKGREYVCYAKDLNSQAHLSEKEKAKCLDSSQVLGPNW